MWERGTEEERKGKDLKQAAHLAQSPLWGLIS